MDTCIDTVTKKNTLKKKIIETGIGLQLEAIDNFRRTIDEMIAVQEKTREKESDSYQQCFKAETTEIGLLQEQLHYSKCELAALMRLQSSEDAPHCVEYGTLVKTDKEAYFISAQMKQYHLDGLTIRGISVDSLIYKAMKGKRCGEIFNHGVAVYQIEEIF